METIKEQQARKVLETQFTQTIEKPSTETKEQRNLENIMDSSPLAKLATLKEENRQRHIQHQLDAMEASLKPPALPTPPDTPPPKASK